MLPRPSACLCVDDSVRLQCERQSEPNPLHLVLRQPLLGAVIELGRARAFMRRHFLRVFERAAIGKISGDAGRAEGVIADRRIRCRRRRRAGGSCARRPTGSWAARKARWRRARGWCGTASPCGPRRCRRRRYRRAAPRRAHDGTAWRDACRLSHAAAAASRRLAAADPPPSFSGPRRCGRRNR